MKKIIVSLISKRIKNHRILKIPIINITKIPRFQIRLKINDSDDIQNTQTIFFLILKTFIISIKTADIMIESINLWPKHS